MKKSIPILFVLGMILVLGLTSQSTITATRPAIAKQVDALLDSADFYHHKSLDSALEFSLRARELASENNYIEGEVNGLAKAALTLTFKGEPVKMQEIYNQAIYTSRNLKDKSALINTYFAMGISYRTLFHFDQSYFYYQQAMDLVFDDLENQSDAIMAKMYDQLAYLLFRELNDSTVSIEFMNKSKDLYLKDGNFEYYVDMFIKIGDVFRYNRHNSMARFYFDSTRILLQTHYFPLVDANYNKLMAALLFDLKNLAQGLEHLKKAEQLFIQVQDNKNLADVYTMFAFVASKMNETEKCLDYNYKALRLRQELGHKILISSSYSNLASNFFKLNKEKLAFQYQKKALSLALSASHYYYSHKYAHSLYRMYKDIQQFDSSLVYLEIADSLSVLLPRSSMNNIGSSNLIESKIKLQNKESIENSKLKMENTRNQLEYSIYISLFLLFIIILFVFWIFKLKKNL